MLIIQWVIMSQTVCTADFNGDGKPDIAVANQQGHVFSGWGCVSVLMNYGDGTFHSVNYEIGVEPWFISAADLNADGSQTRQILQQVQL